MISAALVGCVPPPAAGPPPPMMPEFTSAPTPPPAPPPVDDRQVRTTIVNGSPAAMTTRGTPPAARPADITLNFPAASAAVVAQGVLGDILRLPLTIDPGVTGTVTLVTPSPVPRSAVFALFEEALKTANLAITQQGGVFTVRPLDQARSLGVVDRNGVAGFATETVALQFVNADEMRKVLDGVLPGVVSRADPGQNTLLLSGTTGQRTNARALLAQFDVNWLRNMSFALIVPQRTDARLIVPEVDKLINSPDAPTRGLVRLIAMEQLNGILAITAQRQYLDDVRRWIEILDREGQNNERRLFVYRVQNGRSKDLARVLNTAFGNTSGGDANAARTGNDFSLDGGARSGSADDNNRPVDVRNSPAIAAAAGTTAPPGRGGNAVAGAIDASISSDEANNAIVVFGTPRDYAVIEDALRKLDVLPLQVLIEAAITEVTLNDALRYGVQWNFQQGETNFALSDGVTSAVTRSFPGFSFFFSNKSSISAALNALETQTKINVMSAPKLMVLNNQTAALQVGDQVPVATQSAVGVVNPDSPIVNSIEYRDTGVILKVTPRVNAGGLVLLDIAQEVSDVAQTDSSSINSPTISTRRISTSIAVQDGQVIALGGLIRDTRSRGKSGLPLLSRIPIVGSLLFGRTNDTTVRTELLVLLKPRVVRTPDDAQAVTDELRAKIRSIEPITQGRMP
ncbi:MAG: type II secretion system secretin GspD [Polymorphobacter sp.]